MLILRHHYTDGLQPALQTDGEAVVLSPGTTVNLPLSADVFCLGYARDGQRHPCAKKATGRKQCTSCQKEDDFLVCLRCDGATCLQFTQGLKDDCFGQDYSVYLASFGPDVKTGISKTARLYKRWVEQGADYAAQVFRGLNGQQARVIESTLVRSGYLPRITLSQKLALPVPDAAVLQDELESDAFRRTAEKFAAHQAQPKIESLKKHHPDVTVARPTDRLEGTIQGSKGPVLFLDQNGQNRLFVLSNAVGRRILTQTLASYF